MRARLEELDRLAFDLANISTAGYKTERLAKRASDRDAFARELDGRGFFEIETPAGMRYTRNGSFQKGVDGVLTTIEGEPVMGEGGSITLGPGMVNIGADGTIKCGDVVVGRLRLVEFASEKDLIRESGSRFKALTGAEPSEIDARVVGGALEQSNVSIVDRMAALTDLTRGFEALQRGVSTLMNDLDARAISELTRK
jgi:flagellar basal body rod protein FlgG